MNTFLPSADIGQRTSENGLHPKSFQSWRWVFLAAILLAAVAISTFYFSSAQAQGDDGAITGLTLTSTTAGTLTVSWDAASPTPTDYRIDWAKSTEDYQSWKVDDGHVYTAETATTTTITDLSHDTEYKIRMRARYYKGEHDGQILGWPMGRPPPSQWPESRRRRPPLNQSNNRLKKTRSNSSPGMTQTRQQEPLKHSRPPTTPLANSCSLGKPQRLQTPTPTNYHVNWAKSTEDYPADTAEAGNDHPTTTTHTLTGLDYATDYNVRVRARYTDGENAANPWNGPWTETTAQVLQPLPAAPSFMGGTAVTPNSQVLC